MKIEDRILNFITTLKGLSKSEKKRVCKNEVSKLRAKYTDSTVRTYLTRYRKHDSLKNTGCKDYLTLPKKAAKKLNTNYIKKNDKIIENQILVENWKDILNRGIKLLDSNNAFECACGLMLVTGRRMAEILKTGKFTSIRNKRGYVNFDGQLKTKDRHVGKYEIPILTEYKKVNRAIKFLRKEKDTTELSIKESTQKYANSIIAATENSFCDLIYPIKPHDLRKLYAIICVEKKRKTKGNYMKYFAQILGHGEKGITTAMLYDKYRLA